MKKERLHPHNPIGLFTPIQILYAKMRLVRSATRRRRGTGIFLMRKLIAAKGWRKKEAGED
jgi:hypothetical protein